MSLPAYPEYRRSGIDWIPDVPAHWDVCHLKRIASLRSGESITAEMIEPEGLYPVYGGNGLRGYTDHFTHEGRFALVGRQGALCGNVNYAEGKFWASEHAVVATPLASTQTAWLGELLRAMDLNQYSVSAAQPGLSVEAISNLRVPVPPRDEQVSIAIFLARETAKIDALIAEQEKLLALLAEKRQATISHAVTRGLYPNAPMKDSGIPWLGEVPAHWRVTPLKYLVSLKSGGTPSKNRLEYWDGDVPWASAKDLKSEMLADTTDHLTEKAIASGAARLLPTGTVLVVVRGMILARTFPVTQALVPMAINQDLKGILPGAGVEPDFLAWLLRGTADESLQRLDEAGHGTKALRMDAWTSMPMPVPPCAEQCAIAAFLVQRTAQLDELSQEARATIQLLQERRNVLIAAAVTGQIDVRGLVEAQAT